MQQGASTEFQLNKGLTPASSRFRRKMKEINLWLKGVRNLVRLEEWWQVLRQKLIGHYNYYGIGGNIVGIRKFYKNCISLAYKWINRRSQKRSYKWEQYCRFLKYNPLPEPKIYHLTYTLSSLWGVFLGSRMPELGTFGSTRGIK
jgi:hypothetical protein